MAGRAPTRPGQAPENVVTAVEMAGRARGASLTEVVGPEDPLLPPLILRAVYGTGLSVLPVQDKPSDRFQLKAAFRSGFAVPVIWGRWTWVVLQLLGIAFLTAAAVRLGRLQDPPVAWSPFLSPLLLAISPLAVNGAVRVDDAVLASAFGCAALLVLVRARGGDDHWRWLAAGFGLGLAAASHPFGLVMIPFLVVGTGDRPAADVGVRVLIGLVGVLLGAIIGDPRLIEAPGLLWTRFEGAALGPVGLGHIWAGRRLLDALTPLPLLLAVLAVGMAWTLRPGPRAALVGISLPVVALLAFPASDVSSSLLILPAVALLAGAGAGRIEVGVRSRVLVGVVLAVALVAPMVVGIRQLGGSGRLDSREAAAAWLRENLLPGARVVTDFYGPELPPGTVSFTLPFDAEQPEVYAGAYELGWYRGFGTFVLVGTQYDRYRRDPDRYRTQLAFIQQLRLRMRRVQLLSREDHDGPSVEILQRTGPPATVLEPLLAQTPPGVPVPDFYLSLGSAYRRMGEPEAARALYAVAEGLAPDDPRVLLNRTSLLIDEGALMEADRLLGLAVLEHPDVAKLRYQFALVKQKRSLWGEAIGEYKMAIRLDPTFVGAHFNLGVSYLEAGNIDGARNSFRQVLKLAPPGEMRDEADRMVREIEAL
jgi:hypothetical protein